MARKHCPTHKQLWCQLAPKACDCQGSKHCSEYHGKSGHDHHHKSVAIRDTIKIKEVDTIQIVKNGVVVDIRRQYDTIEVDVQCPPDTIRVYQEVEVPTYVPEKKEKNIGKGALLGFIFALVIVKIIGAVLRK